MALDKNRPINVILDEMDIRIASLETKPTLNALTLAASGIVENAAAGTVIGGILGMTAGSTLTLANNAGGRFAISGNNLVAGSTGTDFETATSHAIVIRETLAGVSNSPRDTSLTINVSNLNEQPNLGALSLSSASLTNGTAATGSINGATTGSTIAATGLPSGLTINGPARTWAWSGTGTAGSTNITLTETLGDSANSPRASTIGVTIAAAPTQPITITPQAAAFSDSFVGDGQLATRPNWVVPAGEEDRWITSAGSLSFNKLYDATRRAIFNATMTGNHEIEMDYNTTMEGPDQASGEFENRTYFNLCYVDETNFIRLNYSGGPFDRVTVQGVVNGTEGTKYQFLRPSESAARTKGTMRFVIRNGVMRVKFDGVWSKRCNQVQNYPFDRITMADSGMPASIQAGKYAIQASTWRYVRLDGVATYSNQITIDTDDEFVGRDSVTATGGTWTGTGTYTGFTYSQAAVRIKDFKTGAIVADWAAPKSITASGGTYTMEAFLPLGGPYTVEPALIGSDGIARIGQSRPVLSGYHVVYYGQSNSAGRGGNYSSAAKGDRWASFVNAGAAQNGAFPMGHFASSLTDFVPSCAHGLSYIAAPLLNIPVAASAFGTPGVGIGALIPGAFGWTGYEERRATLKGIIEMVVWDQGEGDADGVQATSDYVAKFRDQLLPALRTNARNPDMKVLIAPFGNFPGGGMPNSSVQNQAQFNRQRDIIRQAHQTLVETVPGVSFASFKLGAHHGSDSYHYRPDQYYSPLCTRDGLTVAKLLGASTYDGRGPIVTGATRSGATITLAIDRNGAASVGGPVDAETFTGTYGSAPTNSFKGYEVSADDFATNLPISGMSVSGDNLVITLTSAPSGAVKVRSMAGANYDDRSLFIGTYTGGLTIPVAPIIKYLTAA